MNAAAGVKNIEGFGLKALIIRKRVCFTDSELSKVSVANSRGVTNLFPAERLQNKMLEPSFETRKSPHPTSLRLERVRCPTHGTATPLIEEQQPPILITSSLCLDQDSLRPAHSLLIWTDAITENRPYPFPSPS